MNEEYIKPGELAEYLGVSLATVYRYAKIGVFRQRNDGLIGKHEAVKGIISAMARPAECGESRVKLPDSKISISTLIAVETIKERMNTSFGRTLEILLLESRTYNEEMQTGFRSTVSPCQKKEK